MSHRDKALAGRHQNVQSTGPAKPEESSFVYMDNSSEAEDISGARLHPAEQAAPSQALWRMTLYENRTLASAVTAAVTGMLAGYPFDSLKTRMQTHHYPSLLACARRSIADEGLLGLYRGLLPPLITASAAKSMSFSVFERTKKWLRRHDPYKHSANPLGLPDFQRRTVGSVAVTAGFSGSISGAVIAALCCPLELIKVQMQLANLLNKDIGAAATATALPPASNSGSWRQHRTGPRWAGSNLSVCREIIRHKGVFGLYYGIGLHVVRDASGTAIYFAAYETVKETLRRLTGSDTTGPLTHMLAGGTCGVVSWLLIFPVDLVKSTMQSQVLKPKDAQEFKGAWQCATKIHSKLGLSGFYRGISVSLIRAFPIHGLNFVVYEWARSLICHLAGQPE
ncbi:hypothetical protein H4R99_007781 [Coemansia sp. RSA 1722]|nr:hypothetical protein IWW45_008588 [Coemansia sp. RSA 485]KAJ2588490.1 hypothetical protein H4R99_007781 [Coemansia sp. RSA 1722]